MEEAEVFTMAASETLPGGTNSGARRRVDRNPHGMPPGGYREASLREGQGTHALASWLRGSLRTAAWIDWIANAHIAVRACFVD